MERSEVKTNEDAKKYAFQRMRENQSSLTVLQGKREEARYSQELEDYDEYRAPLAITEKIEVTIELSTGGDADGYKIMLEKETREVLSGVYYWADWGQYEEVSLNDDELDLVTSIYYIGE